MQCFVEKQFKKIKNIKSWFGVESITKYGVGTTTKGVPKPQVISLDFEWIHWSSEWELMNSPHNFL